MVLRMVEKNIYDSFERTYESIFQEHFLHNRQMLFLVGPRQVGKTTISQKLAENRRHFSMAAKLSLSWMEFSFF